MWHVFKQFITAPTFADQEQTHAARWLNRLILAIIVILSADSLLVLLGILDQDKVIPILGANALGLVINIGALWLIRRGQVRVVAFILLAMLFLLGTYTNAFVFHSIRTPNIMTYFAFIPLAGLLLGRRSMNYFAILCILTIGVIFVLEWRGLIIPAPNTRTITDDLVVLFWLLP